MPRPLPSPLSVALAFLRTARGWTQTELGAAARVRRKMVSDLETGGRGTLTREKLDGLVLAMGYAPADVDLVLMLLGALSPAAEPPRLSPLDPSAADLRQAARAAADLGLTAARLTRSHLLQLVWARRERQALREGKELWAALRQLSPRRQCELVEASPDLWRWELAERLCTESERAAADKARLALHLARLALRVAELAPAEAAWRSLLLGYSWAFVANAQRVANNHAAAEASFAQAWNLWRAGAAATGPFREWRLLDLEGSLRRDQRRFEAALELLERATALAPAAARGRILLKKAFTLEQAGNVDAAMTALRAASPLVEAAGEPRDRWVLGINLLVNLCHLGRYAEATARLPALRGLTRQLGNKLDRLRVRWLGGRIAAGQGNRDEAQTTFARVLRQFASLGNGYDAALVALELAVLHLEQGRAAEVRVLASEMVWIFHARNIHREALAALALFCRAAERDAASTDLTRRIITYLERARHDPKLRFEDAE
jgi:transcriptional regulator with XRE-family HTH domain